MESLPHDICMKILYYAHPTMEESLQTAIEVTAAHRCLKRHHNIWMGVIPPLINWQDCLKTYLSKEHRKELFLSLQKCGCCLRHSKGVFQHRQHCNHIVGSRTLKPYHERRTWSNKTCTCWCRSQMRHLSLLDQDLVA